MKKIRVYDFLAGLNSEFDQVRVQILGKEEVPSLNEVISLFRAKKSQRGIMLEPQPIDSSALVASGDNKQSLIMEQPQRADHGNGDFSKGTSWENIWCTYCKKPRHTKENCWKLHEKPPSQEWGNKGRQQQRQQGQAHLSSQVGPEQPQENRVFNSDEIEKLRNLLGTLEKPSSSGACSLALSGESLLSFGPNVSGKLFEDSWII